MTSSSSYDSKLATSHQPGPDQQPVFLPVKQVDPGGRERVGDPVQLRRDLVLPDPDLQREPEQVTELPGVHDSDLLSHPDQGVMKSSLEMFSSPSRDKAKLGLIEYRCILQP